MSGAAAAVPRRVVPVAAARAFATGPWAHVEMGPPDPILGLTAAFKEDASPNKVNLGVGAYRGNDGKPFVLQCVSEAENAVTQAHDLDHEYGPIVGDNAFREASKLLVLGEQNEDIRARTVTTQALSGTGALRLAAEYVQRFNGSGSKWEVAKDEATGRPMVFMPNPTWANHHPLFADSGFAERKYRYYKPETCGLDFEGMLEDVKAAPQRSFFLFHSCAHNPTGVDPTHAQWEKLVEACLEKEHVVLMDTAYQGFATGNIDGDAEAPRMMARGGAPTLIAQSYAKNMGLYGHRIGAMSVVCSDAEEAERVDSQIKILIRPMYSNPPIHGAKLVSKVLNTPDLRSMWVDEVQTMANRIMDMRSKLVSNLKAEGSARDWTHVTDQIGMFCFSGLTPEECDALRNDYSIYLTRNGRISVAGITEGNVAYLAKGMADVTDRR
jgi:aspartate aminotransferase, mitochondrial